MMKKRLIEKASNVALGYAFLMFWTFIIMKFYSVLFEEKPMLFGQIELYKHPMAIVFFLTCLIAPLIEEILFRHFPLRLLKATDKSELMWPTILFTSVVFGLMHSGSTSILLQGVGGVVFSLVYIKNGYCYWSSTILHFLWNFSLLIGLLNLN